MATTCKSMWTSSSLTLGLALHHRFCKTYRAEVQQGIQEGKWQDLDALKEGIMNIACQLYPKKTQAVMPTPATHELANCAHRMWALFRAMRSHPFTAAGVLTAWKQWTQFTRAHREHKHRAKQRSKDKKYDLLNEAQLAAQAGDMHKVWTVVKSLAPKTKRKTLQLHRQGRIMSPEAELDWNIEVFGDRYGAKSEPTASGRPREQVPVSISAEAIWLQLEHLPVRKAVPPDAE